MILLFMPSQVVGITGMHLHTQLLLAEIGYLTLFTPAGL
jgi:hypothetical protein